MYNAPSQGIALNAPMCPVEPNQAQAGISLRFPVLELRYSGA